uniref:Uncharacterized protein n=1 Tax=Arundo donax TaxID=35708 RepID=A0A0A8XYV6_ARUDO
MSSLPSWCTTMMSESVQIEH